jgi:membrane protein DedA with SNARE-associated domain
MTAELLALVVGTFVSEDLTAVSAGLLVHQGRLPAVGAILACGLGIYAGDLGLWLVGRILGCQLLRWRRAWREKTPASLERFRSWFDRRAGSAILGSRFAPGTRLPLYLAAGAARTSFLEFAAWSFVAVALWTPLLVVISAWLGERVTMWLVLERTAAIATVVLTVLCWRVALRLVSRRGRQQLVASVSILWRWEFWPTWVFYAPVAVWTAWLAYRHGGYRTVTAANPGMPDGGVVGESKFAILSRLPPEWIVPSAVVEPGPADMRIGAVASQVASNGWTFPLVLKPDVGQRGAGVRLAHTLERAAEYLNTVHGRVLIQPYHSGPFEAGVFYYRMPGAARGRILCITDKQFPAVVGNGRSTIEDLIWSHPRYRMQSSTFLARCERRRHEVPADGERVPLGIAGNHAQGAMFRDGAALITPALEASIDAIAREYDGFFVGRFDIRYSSLDAFVAGRDFAIVELNGATAECTNIYDPERSLIAAYRQLFLQWRLVFTIGAVNRERGYQASSMQRLIYLVRAHLRTSIPFAVSD